jgi:hypothetical protein
MSKWLMAICLVGFGFVVGQTTQCLSPLNRSQAIGKVVCQRAPERKGVYCHIFYKPGYSGPFKLNYDYDNKAKLLTFHAEFVRDGRRGKPITEVMFTSGGTDSIKVEYIHHTGRKLEAEWVSR